MSSLIYRTGSLFEAPPGAVLVHACNGQGVWGAGIAAQMKVRFPAAFEKYRLRCVSTPWARLRGVAQVSYCSPFWVASLLVSEQYGARRDSPERVVEATWAALRGLLAPESWGVSARPREFHSPRISAGLFGVPWESTAAVIGGLAPLYGVSWTVWTP